LFHNVQGQRFGCFRQSDPTKTKRPVYAVLRYRFREVPGQPKKLDFLKTPVDIIENFCKMALNNTTGRIENHHFRYE